MSDLLHPPICCLGLNLLVLGRGAGFWLLPHPLSLSLVGFVLTEAGWVESEVVLTLHCFRLLFGQVALC